MIDLQTPLCDVLKTTKSHVDALNNMGLGTVEDLLLYLPRAHEDLSQMQTLCEAPLNVKVTVRGSINNIKRVFTRQKKQLITATFLDTKEHSAQIIWFNQSHIMRLLHDGDEVVLTGKIIEKNYQLQMQSPQFERAGHANLVHSGRLVPIYPQHAVITTKWLREKMILVRPAIACISETLPDIVCKDEDLMSRKDAICALHFPEDPIQINRARDRIAFEKMYRIQEAALVKKKKWRDAVQERLKIPMDIDLIKLFFSSLKFIPTGSQKIAIYEILKDMESGRPMSRLLEGDVGSGKTLVAMAVMVNVIHHGGQCALMVPTEVLARQHAETISRIFVEICKTSNLKTQHSKLHNPVIAFLTGSTPNTESKRIKQGLANGTIDIVIGTHALIEDDVVFNNLIFTIIDEQHRFGVNQREKLRQKGSPHALYMTATPIPRTLALTAYGHHDLSVLVEKPLNRPKVHTKVTGPRDRKTVEHFIDRHMGEGRQVFVICPLIFMNNVNDDKKSVEDEFQRLQKSFPHRRIAILHGKMLPKEKEDTMRRFRNCEYDLLVSTSVIEVGIDIPNASVMIIEGAERFGLAQLHQFRGRVGRGEYKSYCFLFAGNAMHARSERLKAMERVDDGFRLAEIDLRLRGPGELHGLRQSGISEMDMSNLLHPELVVRARRAAQKTLSSIR